MCWIKTSGFYLERGEGDLSLQLLLWQAPAASPCRGNKVKPNYGRKVCFVRLHLGDTSQCDELEPFVSLVCCLQFFIRVYWSEEIFSRKLFLDCLALGDFLEFVGSLGALSCYQRAIFLEFFRLDKVSSSSREQGMVSGALGGFRSLLADTHLTPCPDQGAGSHFRGITEWLWAFQRFFPWETQFGNKAFAFCQLLKYRIFWKTDLSDL